MYCEKVGKLLTILGGAKKINKSARNVLALCQVCCDWCSVTRLR